MVQWFYGDFWPLGFYGVIIFFGSETLYDFGCETLRGCNDNFFAI